MINWIPFLSARSYAIHADITTWNVADGERLDRLSYLLYKGWPHFIRWTFETLTNGGTLGQRTSWLFVITIQPCSDSVTKVKLFSIASVCESVGAFLPRDAMHKCGLCRRAVFFPCLFVCHIRVFCRNEETYPHIFFHGWVATLF